MRFEFQTNTGWVSEETNSLLGGQFFRRPVGFSLVKLRSGGFNLEGVRPLWVGGVRRDLSGGIQFPSGGRIF